MPQYSIEQIYIWVTVVAKSTHSVMKISFPKCTFSKDRHSFCGCSIQGMIPAFSMKRLDQSPEATGGFDPRPWMVALCSAVNGMHHFHIPPGVPCQ